MQDDKNIEVSRSLVLGAELVVSANPDAADICLAVKRPGETARARIERFMCLVRLLARQAARDGAAERRGGQ
jgi:hypothetical protein